MDRPIPIIPDVPLLDPGLGFAEYAEALADAIRGGEPPQFTIGVYGAWGSGKSSLLNAIGHQLNTAKGVVTVFFDAWRYERSEFIVVPLLHAVYRETEKLQDKRVSIAIRKALHSVIYSLNFKVGVVDLDASKLLDSIDTSALMPLDDAFARPFDELRSVPNYLAGKRIVVLIDDLDRCSPDKVVAVLELVNIIMDVPGFIFVLALDYDVLVDAVQHRYPHVSGHDFIEKMVQVPFRVPRLDLQRETFLADLVPDWDLRSVDVPQGFGDYAVDVAELGLEANPRRIKRFVNSFLVLRRIVDRRNISVSSELLAAFIGLQLRWPDQYHDFAVAVLSGDEKPASILRSGVEDTGLQAYAERFFSTSIPPEMLRQLLYLAETVATAEYVAAEVERPMSEVRESNRAEILQELQNHGFLQSTRNERVFQQVGVANLRFVMGKTVLRQEGKNRQGRWSMTESWMLTREQTKAVMAIASADARASRGS